MCIRDSLNEVWQDRLDAATEDAPAHQDEGRPPSGRWSLASPENGAHGAPPVLARAHHGSVSKEQRAVIEDELKAGRLPAVVATSLSLIHI